MAGRRVRADRVIILILLTILVGGALGFGVYKLIDLFSNDKQIETKPIETIEDVRLSLNDYTIYYDETGDLGFNFIVADINFASENNVTCDLASLQTSEKLFLNDISKYTNKLSSAGYDLNKLNINTTGIVSDKNNVSARLFIPFSTDSSKLSIYNSANASNNINFDLTKEAVAATTLKLKDNKEQIIVGSTTVYVSNAYISSTMLHLGELYPLPNNDKIYTYEISVSETKDNVSIVDAILYVKGSDYENHCMNDEYAAVDCENVLNKNLKLGYNGALFFEVLSEEDYLIDSTLLIKFSNSNDWVEITNE